MRVRDSLVLFLALGAAAECGEGRRESEHSGAKGAEQQHPTDSGTAVTRLSAPMRNAEGKDLGILTLTQSGQGIRVTGRLTGLPPGEHAIHLHTTGRCEAPEFESAGGHWNPTKTPHGTQSPGGPHLGDLPNISVEMDSSVTVDVTTPGGTFRNQNPLLDADGAAVVIHAKADDYRSQPSGNAGDRIACGPVGA
jgi:superoxide dismutase, Cu-Zn family